MSMTPTAPPQLPEEEQQQPYTPYIPKSILNNQKNLKTLMEGLKLDEEQEEWTVVNATDPNEDTDINTNLETIQAEQEEEHITEHSQEPHKCPIPERRLQWPHTTDCCKEHTTEHRTPTTIKHELNKPPSPERLLQWSQNNTETINTDPQPQPTHNTMGATSRKKQYQSEGTNPPRQTEGRSKALHNLELSIQKRDQTPQPKQNSTSKNTQTLTSDHENNTPMTDQKPPHKNSQLTTHCVGQQLQNYRGNPAYHMSQMEQRTYLIQKALQEITKHIKNLENTMETRFQGMETQLNRQQDTHNYEQGDTYWKQNSRRFPYTTAFRIREPQNGEQYQRHTSSY